jgi:hypothetical protein
MPRSSGVRRAYGALSPGTCSAKVRRVQAVLSQKNRRTRKQISVSAPPSAASDTWRW